MSWPVTETNRSWCFRFNQEIVKQFVCEKKIIFMYLLFHMTFSFGIFTLLLIEFSSENILTNSLNNLFFQRIKIWNPIFLHSNFFKQNSSNNFPFSSFIVDISYDFSCAPSINTMVTLFYLRRGSSELWMGMKGWVKFI